ncbi:hypothetical protein [Mycolicibacter arupensis]|uniref:Uncharacterized protein n=1 Tax=Mycolicibacter arupensis TaxID=342002 RepID=A0A0F5N2B9_9MYCO|nr:hypothetical protein [Mycolicibacter arupensis]KKC01166.1 hypothetical protein WR43_01450 [Mycolicibacter arupensis]MCV7276368.1 hypothetical protein [Mycolicibacter arupensis]ORA00741.1 hypothetical protein BST15_02975 [Mycolicibacter arupensis]
MTAEAVYAIARHDGEGVDAPLLGRVELISTDAMLLLRDADGRETPCTETDALAVISSTPELREIRAGEESRINCSPDIAAELPFVLQPVPAGGDPCECYAEVNDVPWMAYPTLHQGSVMLPMCEETEPQVETLWAEHYVGEGDDNPLTGDTTIGLATSSAVVEFSRHDNGGIDSSFGVSVRPVDSIVNVFVDWLLNNEVLRGLWVGDSAPSLPVRLFEDAAVAQNHQASWEARIENEWGGSYISWTSLQLHLPGDVIEQVRVALSKRDPQ